MMGADKHSDFRPAVADYHHSLISTYSEQHLRMRFPGGKDIYWLTEETSQSVINSVIVWCVSTSWLYSSLCRSYQQQWVLQKGEFRRCRTHQATIAISKSKQILSCPFLVALETQPVLTVLEMIFNKETKRIDENFTTTHADPYH